MSKKFGRIMRALTTTNKVLNAIDKAGFRLIRTETGEIQLISKNELLLPGERLIKKVV